MLCKHVEKRVEALMIERGQIPWFRRIQTAHYIAALRSVLACERWILVNVLHSEMCAALSSVEIVQVQP